jgi:hypothetical protein
LNALPGEVLAFPAVYGKLPHAHSSAGDYEIWSEEKLQRWSSAQGLSVTTDDKAARACSTGARRSSVPPGITFTLKRPVTEKGSEFANGWVLNLDLAAIRARNGVQSHRPEPVRIYSNLLQCRHHRRRRASTLTVQPGREKVSRLAAAPADTAHSQQRGHRARRTQAG